GPGPGHQPQRRLAPDAAAGLAQYRPAHPRGQAGDAGLPVRGPALAGLLPGTGGAAEAGRRPAGGATACRRPGDPAPGQAHRPAAPLLAADAGDLAAAAALPAAPAQARVPAAVASAFPRRLRFPRT